MDSISIGDRLQIQCYKHNQKVHCCWCEAIILDIHKDYIVCGNDRTLVIEEDGRTWRTKEPAILYFFKHKWFNTIAQLKEDGIYYYCNIASPYIIEDHVIKYIDYDLDLRIFPTGEYKILDRMEYKSNREKMHYSEKLDRAVKNGLDELISIYHKNAMMFSTARNENYHKIYQSLKKSKN